MEKKRGLFLVKINGIIASLVDFTTGIAVSGFSRFRRLVTKRGAGVTAIMCAAVFGGVMGAVGGCVSPVYDTARTYKGITVGGGVAYHNLSHTSGDIDVVMSGVRPDIAAAWAPSDWFSVTGRAGILLATDGGGKGSYPFAGIGCKFSTAWDVVNLALRAELDFPRVASLCPMIGFSIPRRWEILTLGFQTFYGLAPVALFLNIHPFKGAHLFAGLALPGGGGGTSPEVCLGVGYTYTFNLSGKKTEEMR